MNEDMLLAAMDTTALFGLGRAGHAASWIAAALSVTAVFVTIGTLFA